MVRKEYAKMTRFNDSTTTTTLRDIRGGGGRRGMVSIPVKQGMEYPATTPADGLL
jgi:hypothetical protein